MNAIRRQNVDAVKGLTADTVNSQYLLHEVLRQAEDKGETPKLMEIFDILIGLPGVDIEISRQPPASAYGVQMTMGSYGSPLEVALSKGLPTIVSRLVKLLGISPNEELPRVEMNLLQWSIFRNKPELFMQLLENPEVDVHAIIEDQMNKNALYFAIKSFNPLYVEELLKRIDFAKMPFNSVFFEHPAATAIMARKPEVALRILQHPTMTLSMIDQLIAQARTQYWGPHIREEILRVTSAEKEGRKESIKAFGEVLYRKGAEKSLGPLVGSYLGITRNRHNHRRQLQKSRRNKRSRRIR